MEFFGRFVENVAKWIYDGMYQFCNTIYDKIVITLNSRITETVGQLGQDMQTWNAGAFNVVKAAAENVCIPIAGVIFGFIFTWELVSMVQDHNYKENVSPERIGGTMLRLIICLMVCIKSFDIVMFIYYIGSWAVRRLGITTSGTFGIGTSFNDIVSSTPAKYDFFTLLEILGIFVGLCIALVICNACAVIIYFQVLMWFLEMAVFAAPAPIPFATFLNRDWSQTGMNYGKTVFSIGLRGFFMLLFICIYGGFINNLPGSSFLESITMLCGGGLALIILLWKASSIADRVLNTH